jgi:hypothetical protein
VIKGQTLVLAREVIYQILKANKYDPKSLSKARQSPYLLDEKSGVNLAILFQAVQPLKKESKIANIATGVMAMSNEEAHYWFAKISNGRRQAALKAMRVLLGE